MNKLLFFCVCVNIYSAYQSYAAIYHNTATPFDTVTAVFCTIAAVMGGLALSLAYKVNENKIFQIKKG